MFALIAHSASQIAVKRRCASSCRYRPPAGGGGCGVPGAVHGKMPSALLMSRTGGTGRGETAPGAPFAIERVWSSRCLFKEKQQQRSALPALAGAQGRVSPRLSMAQEIAAVQRGGFCGLHWTPPWARSDLPRPSATWAR